MASDLTSPSFYAAMKARHFYATEDCDTRVKFTINNELMGSIITGTTAPAISVYAIDPTNPTAIPTIKIIYGVLGTGVTPVQLASGSINGLSYTDNTLAVGATGYYYADITIAGNRTITSPIWYTKTSPVPVTLLSFTASMNNNRTVQLQWTTTNEINNQKFIVEKSVNGVGFIPMITVNAKGEVSGINTYAAVDTKPNEGINYYRLKQIDKDGKVTYSNVVSISLNKSDINAFSIYPNPVGNLLQLNINSTNKSTGNIVITDVSGRTIKNITLDLIKGYQSPSVNLTNLKPGNYQITLNWNNQSITQKLIKF
jgi:hypothetical protein